MNNYAVYTTETFDRQMSKLSKCMSQKITKLFNQLKENPYVGDQLRYKHLREKRLREKRLYYLVYDDINTVLVIALSSKKNQQATIDHIVKHFDKYRYYMQNLLNKT